MNHLLRRFMYIALMALVAAGCRSRPVVDEGPQYTEPENTQPSSPNLNYVWTYEGERGPDKWANLNPDYVTCGKGKKQSPINLTWKKPGKPARLDFSYSDSQATVDLSTPVPKLKVKGTNQILLNGKVFALESVEFHSPSEHQLSKNSLSMEIQFIHKAMNGAATAVVSLFAIEGRDNPVLNQIWTAFGTGQSQFAFNAGQLMPPQKTHYSYQGSLTTPPCTEGVEWIVLNTPVELSKEQIMTFRSKVPANNRPLQDLNGRKPENH